MKFLTFKYNDMEMVGVLSKDEKGVFPVSHFGADYVSMNELIEKITQEQLENIKRGVTVGCKQPIALEQIKKLAPIPVPKQDIICLGINYMAHAEESARYKEEAFGGERPFAIYFSKRVNEAVADGDFIDGHFDIVDSLDYEVELAVVIGKEAKNIEEKDVFDYIFGYTIINDVSARTLQTQHKQWYFGKSLDKFLPMGPWIVTADEFENPPELKICSKVNGELRQNSNTNLLIFSIAHVICELSKGITLKTGTIIAMGTPSGVGMGFQPPKFLKSGDKIQCEIENIGILTNVVK